MVPTLAVVISIAAVSIFFISGKKKAKNESSNPPLFTQHSGGDDSSVFKQVEQCMQHNPFYEGRYVFLNSFKWILNDSFELS